MNKNMDKPLSKEDTIFKDSRGRFLTQALFFEYKSTNNTVKPLYTLKEKDHTDDDGNTYLSLKRLYLDMGDVMEDAFASEYFYSIRHWKKVMSNKAIKPHVEEWREELEVQLRSRALRNIVDLADNGNYQANKTLLDRGWLDKADKKTDKTKDKVKENTADILENFLQRVK